MQPYDASQVESEEEEMKLENRAMEIWTHNIYKNKNEEESNIRSVECSNSKGLNEIPLSNFS